MKIYLTNLKGNTPLLSNSSIIMLGFAMPIFLTISDRMWIDKPNRDIEVILNKGMHGHKIRYELRQIMNIPSSGHASTDRLVHRWRCSTVQSQHLGELIRTDASVWNPQFRSNCCHFSRLLSSKQDSFIATNWVHLALRKRSLFSVHCEAIFELNTV